MRSRAEELESLNFTRESTKKKPVRKMGYGTIEKRNDTTSSYRARVPYESHKDSMGRYQTRYKTIGTYRTRKDAQAALEEYNRHPAMIEMKIRTFRDLYKSWSENYFLEYPNEGTRRTIECTYAYCHAYYNTPIYRFNVGMIKNMMNTGYVIVEHGREKGNRKKATPQTQERIKSLCNMMFDYAVENELVSENPARKFKITKLLDEIRENTKVKKVFQAEDIKNLWESIEQLEYADMILIGIYTGFRPQELCNIRIEDINVEGKYIIGGMKTKAGRNRTVPIHSEIEDLVNDRIHKSTEYNQSYLFSYRKGASWKKLTYDKYSDIFAGVMHSLNLEGFTPHCTRHTFATFAETSGLRQLAIKQILGHSVKYDVTDNHYKHTDFAFLYREICKLRFESDGGK